MLNNFVGRQFKFSAGHLYKQTQWSVEKNRDEFGKCYSQFGHGHNYILDVKLRFSEKDFTEIDKSFAEISLILADLDHRHLNFEVSEFSELVPTTENILKYLCDRISQRLCNLYGKNIELTSAILHEDDSISAEWFLNTH
jgi:6-pyruvoyltetrahydropterin/6-carboxytetrahydropterin synthase